MSQKSVWNIPGICVPVGMCLVYVVCTCIHICVLLCVRDFTYECVCVCASPRRVKQNWLPRGYPDITSSFKMGCFSPSSSHLQSGSERPRCTGLWWWRTDWQTRWWYPKWDVWGPRGPKRPTPGAAFVLMCMCMCMYVCVCVCVCVCACMFVRERVKMCVCVSAYLQAFMCVCASMCTPSTHLHCKKRSLQMRLLRFSSELLVSLLCLHFNF